MKHRIMALATVALLAACGEAPAPTQPNADALVQVFSNHTSAVGAGAVTTVPFTTVGASTYTVPAGVTSLTIVAVGGGGGGAILQPGGNGAMVTSTLSVTPGQVLDLFVGSGTVGTNWSVGGGTATTVSSGGTPIMIAGAGGGAGQYGAGGSAGGPGGAGGQGLNGSNSRYHGTGGMGGAGGVGGIGGTGTSQYPPNTGGTGGNGNGAGGSMAWYSGGGGAGWGGGGGGGPLSGGGAGGSLGPAGTTFAPASNGGPVGLGGGNGSIQISYTAAPSDVTPPVITPTITGTLGTNGWYTSDVGVTWSVTDPESAISATTGCTASTLSTDSNGVTYSCSATSAGGTASQSVTVKRDATAPVVAYAGNAGTYTVDQQVSITCSASDATSGLASSSCPGASGAAYTFPLGTTTLSASAQDNAGNTNSATTQFTVQVTAASLCALATRWESKAGVAHAMCKQLTEGEGDDFTELVHAQSGKSMSAANANILITLYQALAPAKEHKDNQGSKDSNSGKDGKNGNDGNSGDHGN